MIATAPLSREEDPGLEGQTQGTVFRDVSCLAGLGGKNTALRREKEGRDRPFTEGDLLGNDGTEKQDNGHRMSQLNTDSIWFKIILS